MPAQHWGWSKGRVIALIGVFAFIDLAFLAANMIKIPQGGWFALVAAALVFYVMTTWVQGRAWFPSRPGWAPPVAMIVASVSKSRSSNRWNRRLSLPRPGQVPPAFLANLRHNQAVHESVVFLAVW